MLLKKVLLSTALITSILGSTIIPVNAAVTDLPSKVDNSNLSCFPTIGSQEKHGSCQSFSVIYYQMTHMYGLANNLDAKNDLCHNNIFSPKWGYNMLNCGNNIGNNIQTIYSFMTDHGAATWAEYPYEGTVYSEKDGTVDTFNQFCTTPDIWKNAISKRIQGFEEVQIGSKDDVTPVTDVNDPDIMKLKNYLNNGQVLVFSAGNPNLWHIKGPAWETPESIKPMEKGDYREETPENPKTNIVYRRLEVNAAHVMTVVGYDDEIWTDINGNKKADDGEFGAIKVANSWGGNTYPEYGRYNGFYWVAYDAFNRVSSVKNIDGTIVDKDIQRQAFMALGGGIANDTRNIAYALNIRDSYEPKLLAKFTVNTAFRDLCVELGYSETNSSTPLKTKFFPKFLGDYGGDMYDFYGNSISNVTSYPSRDVTFYLDMTDLVDSYKLDNGLNKRWYITVKDPFSDGFPTKLTNFSLCDKNGQVLKSTGTIDLIANGSSVTSYIDYALKASQGSWSTKASIPEYRADAATATVNNKIYSIGGVDDSYKTLNTLRVYNPSNNSWTNKSNMRIARKNAGAANILGKIYAVGGFTSNGHSKSLEVYDPTTDKWTTSTDMNTARSRLGVTACNGKLYAIGGLGANNTPVATVEAYDPQTGKWTTKASMNTARHTLGVVTINGKIYAIGGNKGTNGQIVRCNEVEEYDPIKNTWTVKSAMPSSRNGLACVAYNGKTYAIGGMEDGIGSSNKVQEFNPVTNTWKSLSNFNNARYSLSAALLNGKIYAIGGWDNDVSNIVEELNWTTP